MMSSLRIGCDLCEIAAVEQMLKDDELSLARLCSGEERHYAHTQARPAQHLAGVFTAKEALLNDFDGDTCHRLVHLAL